jgi:pimeloyl-ACP methyl ester carboxylesterase
MKTRTDVPMRGERLRLSPRLRTDLGGEYLELDEGWVHYQLSGSPGSPVVVLVHGFSVPAFIWDPTFDALTEAGYRVLRYDLYGRGYSDRPPGRYNLDRFTCQLEGLLRALEIENCLAVCGLSMGAVVAADFCNRFAGRVQRLVLVDPAGFPLDLPKWARVLAWPLVGELLVGFASLDRMERALGENLFAPEEIGYFIERYRPQMEIVGFRRAILSTIRAGIAEQGVPIYRQIGSLGIPVLLVWGENDRAGPFRNSSVFLSLVPDTEFLPVPDCGHVPHFEQPALVNQRILEFLNG